MRWTGCAFVLIAVQAQIAAAAVSSILLVSSRSELVGAQNVGWSQLGAAGTQVSQPFQITTDAGFPITVYKNNSVTNYVRADEGNGFVGDFAPGEALLFSTSQTAIDVIFSTPVWGAGVNLQRERFQGNPTTWQPFVRVKRNDGPDVTFVLPPDTNNGLADGSAPFVGVLSTGPTITEILFDSFAGGNTAANDLSVVVPEPLALTPVLAILLLCRRRSACPKAEGQAHSQDL